MSKDIRQKVVKLLKRKKLATWTIMDVAETALSKGQLSNCFHHMKKAGLIEDTGHLHGNMKIWKWPSTAVAEVDGEGVSYHDVGKAITMLLRKQDAQIASDTQTIKDLTQLIADLQVKNLELAEKLNSVTEGRLSVKEIQNMSRRSSLQ